LERSVSRRREVVAYSFAVPVVAGKTDTWKGYAAEMLGSRNSEYKESRRRLGLSKEEVWLQHTPMGDFAIVSIECDDPARVNEGFFSSQDPFDQWFREKILIECHGLDPAAPPPPLNEKII
jgi:hypothetical protein